MNNAVVTKNNKKKIVADFEGKKDWKERLKSKVTSKAFLVDVVWAFVRLILLIGIAFVVLYPFFVKISSSFMSASDFKDVTVKMIPKTPTLSTYSAIITENLYFKALINTFLLSSLCALTQMFICAFVGYGFAKFKFKGRNILFLAVIIVMVIPHDTLQLSLQMKFQNFDIFGIYGFFSAIFDGSMAESGGLFAWLKGVIEGYKATASFNLNNSFWPFAVLSIGGLALKNSLYIFLMRQYFKGVPDELEEAAYIDGSGPLQTYIRIILPISVPMLVTVFLFSFSWQWTDTFYKSIFISDPEQYYLLSDFAKIPSSLNGQGAVGFDSAVYNACSILIIIPLLIVYCFLQKYLVQGIERSGIVG